MLFKKFLIWTFQGQNVGAGWVKNGKKGFLHTSPSYLPTQSCLKTKFLTTIIQNCKRALCLVTDTKVPLFIKTIFGIFRSKYFAKKITRQGSVRLPDADFFWIILSVVVDTMQERLCKRHLKGRDLFVQVCCMYIRSKNTQFTLQS